MPKDSFEPSFLVAAYQLRMLPMAPQHLKIAQNELLRRTREPGGGVQTKERFSTPRCFPFGFPSRLAVYSTDETSVSGCVSVRVQRGRRNGNSPRPTRSTRRAPANSGR